MCLSVCVRVSSVRCLWGWLRRWFKALSLSRASMISNEQAAWCGGGVNRKGRGSALVMAGLCKWDLAGTFHLTRESLIITPGVYCTGQRGCNFAFWDTPLPSNKTHLCSIFILESSTNQTTIANNKSAIRSLFKHILRRQSWFQYWDQAPFKPSTWLESHW